MEHANLIKNIKELLTGFLGHSHNTLVERSQNIKYKYALSYILKKLYSLWLFDW